MYGMFFTYRKTISPDPSTEMTPDFRPAMTSAVGIKPVQNFHIMQHEALSEHSQYF